MNKTRNILVVELDIGSGPSTVAIKDTINIAGVATMAGSKALQNARPASQHADVVQALLGDGFRIIGKSNLHELAYGVTGVNTWTGTPFNQRFPAFIPGGSSSGSAAAVAAGIADAAIGTDTGGSIRLPAACCGVVGLKPTFGLVSRRGVLPARSSLDCVGPLARDVATVERVMVAIARDFECVSAPHNMALGHVICAADTLVTAAVDTALRSKPKSQRPVALPHFEAAFDAAIKIIAHETWAAFGHLLASGDLGRDVADRLEAARAVTLHEVTQAEEIRRQFSAEVDAALEGLDALVLPTLPHVPPQLDEVLPATTLGLTKLVRPFNLSGHPAISLPLPGEQPMAVQLVGRRGSDASLCAVARRVEAEISMSTLAMELTA